MKIFCTAFLQLFISTVSIKSHAQCAPANAGNDVVICSGGSTGIGTSAVSGYTYSWTPGTGLNNANIAQPTASPSSTTTYTLTKTGSNLLVNGTFENTISGWSTDYPKSPGSISSGTGFYTFNFADLVDYNCVPLPWQGSYSFLANCPASNGANYRILYKTITVTSNTDYFFDGWCSDLIDDNATDIIIRFVGNISTISDTITIDDTNCSTYFPLHYQWNSGSNTSVRIEFRFTNNDDEHDYLSLDDLRFAACPETTDDVTVFVGSSSPSVTSAGPITYYNQYETPNSLVLTSTPGPSYQWYKNNVVISGATSQTYSVNFVGNSTYTDYYKCVTSCGTSNIVTFNYVGCDNDNDYPVTISHGGCLSAMTGGNFIQLNAPSLGSGTVYNWWLYYPLFGFTSYFAINSTGRLTVPIGSGYSTTDGVYTKSSKNGAETYMFHTIAVNTGCRGVNENDNDDKGNDIPVKLIKSEAINTKTSIVPNPANTQIIVSSKNAIQRIEIYNSIGVLVKAVTVNGPNVTTISTSNLITGYYSCRIISNNMVETLKLSVQH